MTDGVVRYLDLSAKHLNAAQATLTRLSTVPIWARDLVVALSATNVALRALHEEVADHARSDAPHASVDWLATPLLASLSRVTEQSRPPGDAVVGSRLAAGDPAGAGRRAVGETLGGMRNEW